MLDMWQERLTFAEFKLVSTMPHRLDARLRDERAEIMKREMSVDMRWGFFDHGLWADAKRRFYTRFVHPVMVKKAKLRDSLAHWKNGNDRQDCN